MRRQRPEIPGASTAEARPSTAGGRLTAVLAGAGRRLWRRPRFTALAVLGLALGIGVNAAAWSVLYAVLLRPLPYGEAERIFYLWEEKPGTGERQLLSYPALEEWRQRSRCFDELSGWVVAGLTLSLGGEPEPVTAGLAEANAFRLLGVEPALGRTFTAAVEGSAPLPEVILSHSLWQRRFGATADVLGQRIALGDRQFTVVGVMPAGFPPTAIELWVPLDAAPTLFPQFPDFLIDRERRDVRVWARLAPGVDAAAARRQLAAVARRLETDFPATHRGVRAALVPVREQAVRDLRPALLLLQAGAVAMLLVICANLANLLLAEGAARGRELALRSALGATPAAIFRQLVAESVLVSLAGGAAGLAVAAALLRLLISHGGPLPFRLPFRDQVGIDGTVVAVALAAAVAAGAVTALVPAARLARADVAALLKGAPAGGRRPGLVGRLAGQHGLIVVQTALTVALLVTAALLLESALRLHRVDPGFTARNVLVLDVFLPGDRYPHRAQIAGFYDGVLAAIGGLPGVEGVSASIDSPLGGTSCSLRVSAGGGGAPREVDCQRVAAGYFQTLGVTLLRGRSFVAHDYRPEGGAVVVNRRLAELLWPGEGPVGRRLAYQDPTWAGDEADGEVIGVVTDVLPRLDEEVQPLLYLPDHWLFMSILVRTTGEPLALADAAREALWTVDPRQPIKSVETLEGIVASKGAAARWSVTLSGLAGLFALAIGALGLYGVLSRHVARRRRELAIRVALGADGASLVRRLVGRALVLTAGGCVLGLALALAVGRWLSSLLYQVSAADPWTLGAVAAVMLAVAVAAAWGPSRRAARVDPAASLRAT